MKLIVNGNEYQHNGGSSLSALLTAYGVGDSRVAVLLNDKIIRRSEHGRVTVKDGDRVEIIAFAGGG